MKIICGNIWDLHPKGYYIVIPTNIGWKSNGENVMGRGLAQQALSKFPGVNKKLGEFYRSIYENTKDTGLPQLPLMIDHKNKLIFFPSKSLNKETPHLSWQHTSNLELIKYAARWLILCRIPKSEWDVPIAMSLIGTGNGGLSYEEVLPVLVKELSNIDDMILVIPE